MNWLAHIFLSEQKIDFQIGNFLADPFKGKAWDNASQEMIEGMSTHQIIDIYTDNHEVFHISKARLRESGLLKSIVIDLTYDYMLTKNWDKFCKTPLDEFINIFYTQARERTIYFPAKASDLVNKLIERDFLNKYHNLEHLEISFGRLDKRLSEKLLSRDSASSYFDAVTKNINYLEDDFLEFFPQLCKKVKENTDSSALKHWKI